MGPEGDTAALNAMFERHLPGLLAWVRVRASAPLRERDSSLDLVQSACREVLADRGERNWSDESEFRRWLFTAAERKIADRARYHHRERRDVGRAVPLESQLSDAEAACLSRAYGRLVTPSGAAMANEEIARVESALRELPDDYREVVVLAHLVGLPHAEIARRMERSEGGVRMLLHRALARLALVLGSHR